MHNLIKRGIQIYESKTFPPNTTLKSLYTYTHRSALDKWSKKLVQGVQVLHIVLRFIGCISYSTVLYSE